MGVFTAGVGETAVGVTVSRGGAVGSGSAATLDEMVAGRASGGKGVAQATRKRAGMATRNKMIGEK